LKIVFLIHELPFFEKNFGNSYPVSRGYNIPKIFFVGSQRILWKIFIEN